MKTRRITFLGLVLLVAGLALDGSGLNASASPAWAPTAVPTRASGVARRPASGPVKVYAPLALRNSSPSAGDTFPGSIGVLTYTADEARKQTARVPADGTAASLSATDAAGNTWRLEIPADALLVARQVSLTPFGTVAASDPAVRPRTGVLLEPDGLRFVKPATLSLTLAGGASPAPLMLASHLGAGLIFAEATATGGAVSAPIWHFSTATSGDADLALARRAYDEALASARAFVAAGAPTPLAPPAVPLYCWGTGVATDPQKTTDQYVASFFKPYADVVEPLMGAARTLALLGAQTSGEEDALRVQIAALALDSAAGLVQRYQGETPPDHFLPVLHAAQAAERNYALAGGSGRSSGVDGAWAGRVRDYYASRLRDHHDYRAWPAVLALERQVQLLPGGGGTAVENSVMNFELTTDNAASEDEYHVVNTGLARLRALEWLDPAGTGRYLEGRFATDAPMVLPIGFTFRARMQNFDPCEKVSVDLLVDPEAFGARQETHIDLSGDPPTQHTLPSLLWTASFYHFRDRLDPALGEYRFNTALRIGDATAADQTFTGTVEGFTFNFRLRLTHTPGGAAPARSR